MGAENSTAVSKINRKEVLDATRTTRGVVDILLQYLLKEVNIRDFYLLSSPTECKKYVLALANSLNRIFYQVAVEPIKGRDGVIMFRSLKQLAEPSETETLQRQSLCMIIAYFYTRIFQIYGALAITLLDDASVMANSGLTDLSILQRSVQGELIAPGQRPYYTRGGDADAAAADLKNLGYFSLFRPYLREEETPYGHLFKTSKFPLSFKRRPVAVNIFRGETYEYGAIYIGYKGIRSGFVQLEINAVSKDPLTDKEIRIELDRIRIENVSVVIPSSVITPQVFRFVRDTPQDLYHLKGDTSTPLQFIEQVVEQIMPFIRNSVRKFVKDAPQFAVRGFKYGENTDADAEAATEYEKGRTNSQRGVPEEFRLERTLRSLAVQKPIAHCVARALQLLQAEPIDDRNIVSNICTNTFLETKDGKTNRSGMPKRGESLDKSPGLSALSHLFYDTIQYGTPKITMSNQSLASYTDFMKKLSIYFGDSLAAASNVDESAYGTRTLSDVHNKRDQEICGSTQGPITVPGNKTRDIYEVVKQLYRLQIAHAQRAGGILTQLFLIQRSSGGEFKITIHPDIFKKGMSEINRINQLARQVLVDYYTQCERTYLSGVQLVLRSRQQPSE